MLCLTALHYALNMLNAVATKYVLLLNFATSLSVKRFAA